MKSHWLVPFMLLAATFGSRSHAVEAPPPELMQVRDPFKRPDLPKIRQTTQSELEKFATTDYKMLGVLTGPERLRAMVKSPEGKTIFVSENMRMGTRDGIVRKITTDSILVREKIVNVLGQEENIDTELTIKSD
jgi:Tfp pilus assembly protein PilP